MQLKKAAPAALGGATDFLTRHARRDQFAIQSGEDGPVPVAQRMVGGLTFDERVVDDLKGHRVHNVELARACKGPRMFFNRLRQ